MSKWRSQILVSCCLWLAGCSYDAIRVSSDDAGDHGAQDAGDHPAADGGDNGPMSDAGATQDAGGAGQMGGPEDAGQDATVAEDAGEDFGADAGDAGGDSGAPSSFVVEPTYPGSPGWNDYVISNTSDACGVTNHILCEHTGPRRKVVLPDETSCTGLEIHDDKHWLSWACAIESSHVVVRSGALLEGVTLLDLLDLPHLKFKKNFVTVVKSSNVIAQTDPAEFWSTEQTPVHIVAKNTTAGEDLLDEAGAIYVITQPQIHDLRITVDGVSVISTVKNVTSVPSTRPILSANGRALLWLQDLDFDLSGHAHGVEIEAEHIVIDDIKTHRDTVEAGTTSDMLLNLIGGPVSDLTVEKPAHDGLDISLTYGTLARVAVTDAQNDCMHVKTVTSEVSDLSCMRAGGRGIQVHDAVDTSSFRRLRVSDTGGTGVYVGKAEGSSFNDIVVSHSGVDGFFLGDSLGDSSKSQRVFVKNLVTTNNAQHGARIRGDNHRVISVASAGNGGDGLRIEGKGSLVMHDTLVQNVGIGLHVMGSSTGATFLDTVAANNGGGVTIESGATQHRFFDIYAGGNTVDLTSAGEDGSFFGTVKLSAANSCDATNGVSNPGFSEAPCNSVLPSTATFTTGAQPSQTFIGVVSAADSDENSTTHNPQADGTPLMASSIVNWAGFSDAMRTWGRPGAKDDVATRGPCNDSTLCVMRDLRLGSASALVNTLGPNPEQTLADGSHLLTHFWSASLEADCGAFGNTSSWNSGTSKCSVQLVDYASDGPYALGGDGLCQGADECVVWRTHGAYIGDVSDFSLLGSGQTSVPGITSTIQFWATTGFAD